jgi:hypothetical protein
MKQRSPVAAGGVTVLLLAFLALTVWTGFGIVRSMGPGGDGVVARTVTSDGVECLVTQRWNGWTEPYTVSFYSRPEGGDWGWNYIAHESFRWASCELVEDPDSGIVRVMEGGRTWAEYDNREGTFSLYDDSGRVTVTVEARQKLRDPPAF